MPARWLNYWQGYCRRAGSEYSAVALQEAGAYSEGTCACDARLPVFNSFVSFQHRPAELRAAQRDRTCQRTCHEQMDGVCDTSVTLIKCTL